MSSQPQSLVVQPGEGESYWQPVPANGYVEVHVSERVRPGVSHIESGAQAIAPGGFVREHTHDVHEELIMVYAGQGIALVDGVEHPMQPGTSLYLAPHSKHKFINNGNDELRFFWVLMPGGLSEFFGAIGRPRSPGEPAPAPFPRPENVGQIERNTVFGALEK